MTYLPVKCDECGFKGYIDLNDLLTGPPHDRALVRPGFELRKRTTIKCQGGLRPAFCKMEADKT